MWTVRGWGILGSMSGEVKARRLSVYDTERYTARDPIVARLGLRVARTGLHGGRLKPVCPQCGRATQTLHKLPNTSTLPLCANCLGLDRHDFWERRRQLAAIRTAAALDTWHDIATTVPEFRAWMALQRDFSLSGVSGCPERMETLRMAAYGAVEATLHRLAIEHHHKRIAGQRAATPRNRAAASARLKPASKPIT